MGLIYRHVQPIEHWGVSCGISEPDIGEFDLHSTGVVVLTFS